MNTSMLWSTTPANGQFDITVPVTDPSFEWLLNVAQNQEPIDVTSSPDRKPMRVVVMPPTIYGPLGDEPATAHFETITLYGHDGCDV